MNSMMKSMAALVIVIGTAAANASGLDSLGVANSCRVVKVSNGETYRVFFQAIEAGQTKVQIEDQNGQVVHVEALGTKDEFVRDFNLGALPEGDYTFKIVSGTYAYKHLVTVSRWGAESFRVTKLGESVAATGLNDSGKEAVLLIHDRLGNQLYKKELKPNEELKALFSFENLQTKDVIISVYNGGHLAKETIVKI